MNRLGPGEIKGIRLDKQQPSEFQATEKLQFRYEELLQRGRFEGVGGYVRPYIHSLTCSVEFLLRALLKHPWWEISSITEEMET